MKKLNIFKQLLINKYLKNRNSSLQISKKLKCAKPTILSYLKKYNIKIRTVSEAKKGKHCSPKTEFKKGQGAWNKGLTKESDKRVKKYGISISKSRIKKQTAKGKKNGMYGKKAKHGKRIKYKGSYMRSTWEIAYAKYCIINHIKYRYEPKVFEIVYKYNNIKKEGTYRPDFYLPKQDLWIEIKGWWRDDAKVKFNAFKKQYSKIKIKIINKKVSVYER